jgi:hypothetical protein
MKIYSMIGSGVVTLALASYSLGFFTGQRKKLVDNKVLVYFTVGVLLDVSATILMILGSTTNGLTLHGVIGYSSLLGMGIDTYLLWRHFIINGSNVKVDNNLHVFSRITYTWWVIAFITGGLLVAFK